MDKLEALRVVRKIANFSRQSWPEDKIQDWVTAIEPWDQALTLKALEMHVLTKKLDSLAELRETYTGLVKRRQEEAPAIERGRAGEDEIQRVKASIQAFLASRPDLKRSYDKAKGEPTSPGSARRMAQEPRRAPEDSF